MQVNQIIEGDCHAVLASLEDCSIAACITDPPYNYEFIGHRWDDEEITRRVARVKQSKTLVKNIPYGSGLAGGVRNPRWYERVRSNILEYEEWCYGWGTELLRVCKPGAFVAVFNSTRTLAHVQVALERAGFYARDCLVYRRHSGIPKGLNAAAKLEKLGDPNAGSWSGWHSCLRAEWEAIVLVQKPLEGNYLATVAKYGVGLMNTRRDDGGFQSNILEGIQREPGDNVEGHATVKPLQLMERLVKLLVPPNPSNVLLDPFAGSGSTLLAAQRLGIPFVGVEINPDYVRIARERLSARSSAGAPIAQRETRQPFRLEMP